MRYLGQIVEIETLAQIFGNPAHQPEQRPTRVILRGIGEGHLEGDVSGSIRPRRLRG